MDQRTKNIAAKFHRLSDIAIQNGGLWCHSGNDTEKSVAKIIAANTDIPFRQIIAALTITRPNWHDEMQYRMKRTRLIYDRQQKHWHHRFHIETIARASSH